eukprot:3838768-Rhodomonas_salina.1
MVPNQKNDVLVHRRRNNSYVGCIPNIKGPCRLAVQMHAAGDTVADVSLPSVAPVTTEELRGILRATPRSGEEARPSAHTPRSGSPATTVGDGTPKRGGVMWEAAEEMLGGIDDEVRRLERRREEERAVRGGGAKGRGQLMIEDGRRGGGRKGDDGRKEEEGEEEEDGRGRVETLAVAVRELRKEEAREEEEWEEVAEHVRVVVRSELAGGRYLSPL